MIRLPLAPAFLIAAALGGCSSVDLVNGLVPRDGYQVKADQAYGEGARRRADIYQPNGATAAPIVVFFYGGSWDSGSKADYLFVGQALASSGFVAVVPDYRVYPDVRFPAFLADAAASVRWARDHAASIGGDPHRILLMGHSAGAYIALMLALDPHYLNEVGLDPARDLRGVVGLAGPYDFLPLTDPKLQAIFGPPETLARTQPITYASGSAPLLFLAAGTDDTTVDPANTTRLAARISALHGAVEVRSYPGIGHRMLIGVVGTPLRFVAPVFRDVAGFLHQASSTQAVAAE